jgi:hypothetical protein
VGYRNGVRPRESRSYSPAYASVRVELPKSSSNPIRHEQIVFHTSRVGRRSGSLGGQNFGVADTGSWDDGGGADVGGGDLDS